VNSQLCLFGRYTQSEWNAVDSIDSKKLLCNQVKAQESKTERNKIRHINEL